MAAVRHLEFFKVVALRQKKVVDGWGHLPFKFCDDWSKGSELIAIYRNSRWLPSAILNF